MVKSARSATDWEDAALEAIAAHGLRSLSIPDLARSLGVTKGSFYWHFTGLPRLIESSLRRWEEIDRAALEKVREIDDPRARLTALFREAMKSHESHALYIALSPSSDPAVTAILRRINDRRLQLLVDSFRELGLERAEAREQALLTYSAYVGALHLRLRGAKAYVAHAVKTLIPQKMSPRA